MWRSQRVHLRAAVVAVWLLGVGAGLWALYAYKATPGDAATAPAQWPGPGAADAGRAGWRLLVFLHPRCPCSRATVAELARLVTAAGGRLDVRVRFVLPPGLPRERPRSWDDVAALPGVRVGWDEGGIAARRFGARTSGQVLLYDPAGVLRFRGGITPARGHEGDNEGRDAIIGWLNGNREARSAASVFGCPLFDTPAE